MAKMIDMTGQRYGRLVVITKYSNDKHRRTVWLCKCDCGKETTAYRQQLTKGKKHSCGCLQKEHSNIKLRPFALKALKTHVNKVTVENTRIDMIKLNKKPSKSNQSGITGVHWENWSKKWRASICIKGKDIKLGRFDEFEDAVIARKNAEKRYFEPIINRYNDKNKKISTNTK